MTGPLSQKHTHNRNYRALFDDGPHHYYCDFKGDGTYTRDEILSVTTLIKKFLPDGFDADRCIDGMFARCYPPCYRHREPHFRPYSVEEIMEESYNTREAVEEHVQNWLAEKLNKTYIKPDGKPMTRAEIKAAWKANGKAARERGTRLHDFADRVCNGVACIEDAPSGTEYDQLAQFFEENKDPVYLSEALVFSDYDTCVAGATDVLFVDEARMNAEGDQTDTLYVKLKDYKCSKGIKKNSQYGQTGIYPCDLLKCANFYTYALQLSLYAYLWMTYYHDFKWRGKTYKNIVVTERALLLMNTVPLKRSVREYKEIPVPYMKYEIEEMMRIRKESLAARRAGKPGLFPLDPMGVRTQQKTVSNEMAEYDAL